MSKTTVRDGGGDSGWGVRRAHSARRNFMWRFTWRFTHRRRRHWMLMSLLSFWLALMTLALPLATASADTNSLDSYGATASGWAIQPHIVNDAFQNVPVADQAAPYVFVSMDSTPGSQAQASYFFPGTAINAVPNTQGVAVSVPTGVEARFPGNGAGSGKVNGFNDGVATQADAGSQSAQASEGYALAQAAVASYQFAPAIPAAPQPPGVPGAPSLPAPPALPTIPAAAPTATAGGGGGSAPTPTPGSGAPTATPCASILNICLGDAGPSHGGVNAALPDIQPTQGLPPATLPDPIEQQLSAALKAAQVANPGLLALAGGQPVAMNPTLPYAAADISSQAESRATDAGVTVTVQTRMQHVELFQGLITFGSVESTLQAAAPASTSEKGSGTISTTVTGATIAGIPVVVDQNGVTVKDQNASAAQAQALSDQLNAALKQAGVHVSVTRSVITTDVGTWQGAGAGVTVTADLSPATYNPPAPANGLPGTHVDFSIAQASANIYATPGSGSSGDLGGSNGSGSYGGGFGYGGGGGFCFLCGGGGGGGGATTTTTPGASSHTGGAFTLPAGLRGAPLLALVFVIQGLSTAAVAATAGLTSTDDVGGATTVEEERSDAIVFSAERIIDTSSARAVTT